MRNPRWIGFHSNFVLRISDFHSPYLRSAAPGTASLPRPEGRVEVAWALGGAWLRRLAKNARMVVPGIQQRFITIITMLKPTKPMKNAMLR
jgi:hypothetical protein